MSPLPLIVAQLSDALPSWFGTVVLVTGLLPALSCFLIWLRIRKPPRDALIAAGVYYAITATSYLGGNILTSGQAGLLFGCGNMLLLVAGLPLAIVLYMAGRPYGDRTFDENECERCGYNLTLNTSGRCPECGVPVGRRQQNTGVNRVHRIRFEDARAIAVLLAQISQSRQSAPTPCAGVGNDEYAKVRADLELYESEVAGYATTAVETGKLPPFRVTKGAGMNNLLAHLAWSPDEKLSSCASWLLRRLELIDTLVDLLNRLRNSERQKPAT